MNQYNTTGHLTKDPELATTPNGVAVCRVRLAVDGAGRGLDDDGRPKVGYVNVTEFGPRAMAAAEYLKKGSLVAVSGRLEWRDWEDDNGRRREAHQVVGEIKFLANLRTAAERGRQVEQRQEQAVDASTEPTGSAGRQPPEPAADQLAAREFAPETPSAIAGIER